MPVTEQARVEYKSQVYLGLRYFPFSLGLISLPFPRRSGRAHDDTRPFPSQFSTRQQANGEAVPPLLGPPLSVFDEHKVLEKLPVACSDILGIVGPLCSIDQHDHCRDCKSTRRRGIQDDFCGSKTSIVRGLLRHVVTEDRQILVLGPRVQIKRVHGTKNAGRALRKRSHRTLHRRFVSWHSDRARGVPDFLVKCDPLRDRLPRTHPLPCRLSIERV